MWVLMAVTDMQKLTVIGLNSSRTPFLHELMRLGVVEINSQEGVVNDEEWMPDIFRTSNSVTFPVWKRTLPVSVSHWTPSIGMIPVRSH